MTITPTFGQIGLGTQYKNLCK